MVRLLNGFMFGFGGSGIFGVPAKAAENPQTSVSNSGKEADATKTKRQKQNRFPHLMRELEKQANRYTAAKRNWKKHSNLTAFEHYRN